MTDKENESRWFLITHEKCGAIFTMNMNNIADETQKGNLSSLRCPGCFEKIDHNMASSSPGTPAQMLLSELNELCHKYKVVIQAFKNQGWTIREIGPDEAEAMKLPLRESFFKDADFG